MLDVGCGTKPKATSILISSEAVLILRLVFSGIPTINKLLFANLITKPCLEEGESSPTSDILNWSKIGSRLDGE